MYDLDTHPELCSQEDDEDHRDPGEAEQEEQEKQQCSEDRVQNINMHTKELATFVTYLYIGLILV